MAFTPELFQSERQPLPTRREILHQLPPFIHGIAVSNLANETNPDHELPADLDRLLELYAHSQVGLELQIEQFDFARLPTPQAADHPPFLGVHLPIQGVDLQAIQTCRSGYECNLQVFDWARQLAADYVVIHLLTREKWDELDRRQAAITQAKADFTQIALEARRRGFTGRILFENLEFPLYPSTQAEVLDCARWANQLAQIHQLPVGLALDISHLWHTGKMIAINAAKGDVMARYLTDPFVQLETTFDQYLVDLVRQIGSQIELLHITNSVEHDTHLMPGVLEDPQVTGHAALNLRSALISLVRAYDFDRLWVINEAHHFPYDQMALASLEINQHLCQ